MITTVLFLVLIVALSLSPLIGQTTGQTPIECVVVNSPPTIDGTLDDSCWTASPKTTDFYDHNTAAVAPERTEAWICCDQKFIYAAFRCYDSKPGEIKAEQKSRGGDISNDDYVALSIDPYHDMSTSVLFQVTPRGVQAEDLQSSDGGKIEWIGDWTAAAKRLDDGYTVEMRIPFSILKYGKNQKEMGIAFRRRLARTGQGLWAPNCGPNHEVARYLLWRNVPAPNYAARPLILGYSLAGAGDGINDKFATGLDIKRAIGTGLTGVLTMNPDFRNVEQSIGSISFSYNEKYLPDSRPFFMEGAGYFPSSTLFYSRRITDIDTGAKLVGKQGKYSYAFLNTREFGSNSNFVGKIARQYGESGGYSAAMTHTNQVEPTNAAYHAGLWRRLYKKNDRQITADVNMYKSTGGTDNTGDRLVFGLNNSAPVGKIGWYVNYYDIDPNFVPALGIREETNKRGFSGWFGRDERPSESKVRIDQIGCYWDLLDRKTGGVFKNTISGYLYRELHNGLAGRIRYYTANRPPNHDNLCDLIFNWNVNDLYKSGEIQYSFGKLAGGRNRYFYISQSAQIGDNMAIQTWMEREVIEAPSPYAGTRRQIVTSLTYDLSVTQGVTARLVRSGGQTNLSGGFRRRVSAGMDAYIIYGDPNAENTRNSLMVKLVEPF